MSDLTFKLKLDIAILKVYLHTQVKAFKSQSTEAKIDAFVGGNELTKNSRNREKKQLQDLRGHYSTAVYEGYSM